jgi:hypothetical protein
MNVMIAQIIWLLSWPLLIAVSYWGITWTIKRYKVDKDGASAEEPF